MFLHKVNNKWWKRATTLRDLGIGSGRSPSHPEPELGGQIDPGDKGLIGLRRGALEGSIALTTVMD